MILCDNFSRHRILSKTVESIDAKMFLIVQSDILVTFLAVTIATD